MAGRKKKEALSSQDRRKALVADLQKRYPGKVFRGEDYTMAWALRRLPTGLIELDLAMNGGFPGGGMSIITGKPGSGKNWLINQAIRICQEQRGEDAAIAVIGTELAYDKTQAHGCGVRVPMSGLEVDAYVEECEYLGIEVTPEDLEWRTTGIGEFLVVPPTSAEECFDIAIDLVRSGEFDIVALDSFGSILPQAEEDKDLTDNARVGGAASLNTRLMGKLCSAFSPDTAGNPNLTAFLGVNQVRDNMQRATPYSPMTKESGGWALKHGRFVTLNLTRIGAVKTSKKVHIGKEMKWEILKQKAGGHEGGKGKYNYYWKDMSFNRAALAVRLGVQHGLIVKSGSWYAVAETDERMGQGEDKAGEWLLKADLLKEMEARIYKASGVRCRL